MRDVHTWAHAPIVAGIIVAAAALEEITLVVMAVTLVAEHLRTER